MGASWLIFTWWLGPFLAIYVGFIPILGGLVYSLTGELPPNLIICLVINFVYGVLLSIALAIILFGISIGLNVIERLERVVFEVGPERTTTPTFTKMAASVSQKITQVTQGIKQTAGRFAQRARGIYSKARNVLGKY